jgi:hypothetical protein
LFNLPYDIDAINDMTTLPHDNQIDTKALSQLFSNTTNSYKLLFFLAILKHLQEARMKSGKLNSTDLIETMLYLALYPIKYFNLSFGPQDQMAAHLSSLEIKDLDALTSTQIASNSISLKIHQCIKESSAVDLEKYVPFRLLQPFFTEELKGIKDGQKNAMTYQLAEQCFDIKKPLYRIEKYDDVLILVLHPQWITYLTKNYLIVEAWAEFAWVSYLQRKNPNSPNILNKIYPPSSRVQLTAQRKIWDEFLHLNPISCIYSGQSLSPSNYALDHFIPWSYMGHDQHWNLIPVIAHANGQKSNLLPNSAYLDKFCEIQHQYFAFLNARKKLAACEDYVLGLNSSISDLKVGSTFQVKLSATISNISAMAELQGFSPNWTYDPI